MVLRTKIKFILPAAVILAAVIFYFYVVANGYSPYVEGIAIEYFIDSEVTAKEISLLIIGVMEENLAGAPRLKKMLEVALEQEFFPYADGYNVLDAELNSCWINRDDNGISVQIGMSLSDLSEF